MNNSALDLRPPRDLSPIWRWLALVAILIFLVAPVLPLIAHSFAFRWFFPQFIPQEFSLDAWQFIFSARSNLPIALGNSLAIGLAVTVISVIIGIPAGRAMGLYRFRGKQLVEFLILAPTIVPGIAVSMGIHIVFLRTNLANTLLGVILVHLVPTMPYVVLTLSGVFANYNADFEDQARTLGANTWRTFRHVTLPAIFPGVMVAGLFAFLVSWSQYILTQLIGGGRIITLPTLLFSAIPGGRQPQIAALALVFIAPAILILLVTARYLTGDSETMGGFGRI